MNNRKRVGYIKEPKEKLSEERDNIFSWRHFLTSEAIILALMTAISYIWVYSYEFGYYSYFGIPSNLITINVSDILNFSVSFIFILSIFAQIILLILFESSSRTSFFSRFEWRFALPIGLSVLFFILLPVIYYGIWNIFWPVLIFLGIFIIFLLIVELIIRKIKKPTGIYNSVFDVFTYKLDSKLGKWVNLNILNILAFVVTFFIVIAFLRAYGESRAMKETNFYIVNTKPECVMLYFKGEINVCSPFDRQNKVVDRSYKFIKLADSPDILIRYESVGPLRLKSLSTPTPTSTISPLATVTPIPKSTTAVPSMAPTK